MKTIFTCISTLLLLPLFSSAQKITYSDVLKENSKDMNYHIIGKVSSNLLILKDQPSKYAISIYDDNMALKDKINLDFISSKTFNVDFIEYPDSFYVVYEYKKKGIVYCMAMKMDGRVKPVGEPILLDTTRVIGSGDNKIYSFITSEDKQKIMIFKIQEKDDSFNFVTLLYDKELQLIHKTRLGISYDERNDIFSDFHLDNEGNLVFTRSVRIDKWHDIGALDLITKTSMQDTFSIRILPLDKLYIGEINIKVDNLNKRYLLNSFYSAESRGNIEGIYSVIWTAKGDSAFASIFTPFADSIRNSAKELGTPKTAFNDYFINKILLRKDGGYVLIAEDFVKQVSASNTSNGNDYLNSSRYDNAPSRYYNPPSRYNNPPSRFSNPLSGYGRPYYNNTSPYNGAGAYNNNNIITRSYYYNILVFSISNTGVIEWGDIIYKNQSADNTDKFLSFATLNTDGIIHFLFNSSDKKDPVLIDDVISTDGKVTRNPSLKSYDKGYDFMIRFAKKTGAKQIIVPCSYRGQVCFAKIDF